MDEFEAVLSETVQMFNLLLSEHSFVCFSVPEHDFFFLLKGKKTQKLHLEIPDTQFWVLHVTVFYT